MIVNKATARIAVPTAISSNMEARGCLAIVTSTGLQLFAVVDVLTLESSSAYFRHKSSGDTNSGGASSRSMAALPTCNLAGHWRCPGRCFTGLGVVRLTGGFCEAWLGQLFVTAVTAAQANTCEPPTFSCEMKGMTP